MKKLFISFFLFFGIFASFALGFNYGESIDFELLKGNSTKGFGCCHLGEETCSFASDAKDLYTYKCIKSNFRFADFTINEDNTIQGEFIVGLGVAYGPERSVELVNGEIIGTLQNDGTMKLEIVNGSSKPQGPDDIARKPGLCHSYTREPPKKDVVYVVNEGSKPPEARYPVSDVYLNGFIDKNGIVVLELTYCDGGTYIFSSSEEVDLVLCEMDEILIDGECESIDDLCSDDDLVDYDVDSKQCFCPVGYKLTNEKKCEEVEEMLFEVSYPDQTPPFLMDGQTHKIKVSVKNGETNEPMKARFSINYTNGPAQGKIVNTEEISVGEYLLTYQPAVIENGETNGRMDGLYIFYDSPSEGKELYKTYEIALGAGNPIEIKKSGFEDAQGSVVFGQETAQVRIVTKNADGENVPVKNAIVLLTDSFAYEKTDENGLVTLKSPEYISSEIPQEIKEIEIQMLPEIQEFQQKALKQYRQIIEGDKPVTSVKVRNFVENFAEYIAQAEEDEVDKYFVGLKRVAYTLLYMTEGKNLITDISSNVAGSIKTQITDTLDMIGAGEAAGKYLGAKIDENIALPELAEVAPEIQDKLDKIGEMLQNKAISTIKWGIKKYAPSFKAERTNELFSTVFGKYGRDDMLEKGVGEIQKVSEQAVEDLIKNYLSENFDEMLTRKMKELEKMIDSKDFASSSFVDDINLSKMESLNLRDKYMTANEVSYNINLIKDVADLVNNIAGEAMKITGIWKTYAEIGEKGYKAIRSIFLNNADIYYRIDAYATFMEDVEGNINRGIGIAYLPEKNYKNMNLMAVAYAENFELSTEQISNAGIYRGSQEMIEILDILNEANDMLLTVYPDDNDLLEIRDNLMDASAEEYWIVEQVGEEAKINAAIISQELEKNTSNDSLTVGDWLVLIVFLGLILGVILLLRKVVKKIKNRKKKGK